MVLRPVEVDAALVFALHDEAVIQIADRCPRLVAQCYWAGSSAIAIEELEHRESFDLDFHTQEALVDTRPLLAELERAFPDALEVVQPPDRFGSGFTSSLTLAVSECQAEFLNWFVANASLKYTLLAHDDYAAAAAAPPDAACPAGGSSKGVTEADVRARWPALLG